MLMMPLYLRFNIHIWKCCGMLMLGIDTLSRRVCMMAFCCFAKTPRENWCSLLFWLSVQAGFGASKAARYGSPDKGQTSQSRCKCCAFVYRSSHRTIDVQKGGGAPREQGLWRVQMEGIGISRRMSHQACNIYSTVTELSRCRSYSQNLWGSPVWISWEGLLNLETWASLVLISWTSHNL